MQTTDKTKKPARTSVKAGAKASQANGPFAMPTGGLEPVFEAFQRSLADAGGANSDWVKRMMEANAEITHFVQHRLAKDREATTELSRCKSPPDTALVYARFVETAMREYSEEMTKLAGLYAEQAQWAMTEVQNQLRSAGKAADKAKGSH